MKYFASNVKDWNLEMWSSYVDMLSLNQSRSQKNDLYAFEKIVLLNISYEVKPYLRYLL